MAKQTFTTGQVLTAAQMTSLQQTAMGGGSPSVKTTSYVLVAADAGTVIQMNAAGATTITVNTALFAAGDSVQIQNIGAGTCTITAGTATVTTAGSLALTQWEGGQLYFTSTSASIFFDVVQSGSASNLTLASIASGSLNSGTSLAINSLTQDFLQIYIEGVTWATSDDTLCLRINNNSTGNYTGVQTIEGGTGINTFNGGSYIGLTDQNRTQQALYTSSANGYVVTLQNCKATGFTNWSLVSIYQKSGSTRVQCVGQGQFTVAAQVTSLNFFTFGGKTFNGAGTYTLIGG